MAVAGLMLLKVFAAAERLVVVRKKLNLCFVEFNWQKIEMF